MIFKTWLRSPCIFEILRIFKSTIKATKWRRILALFLSQFLSSFFDKSWFCIVSKTTGILLPCQIGRNKELGLNQFQRDKNIKPFKIMQLSHYLVSISTFNTSCSRSELFSQCIHYNNTTVHGATIYYQ